MYNKNMKEKESILTYRFATDISWQEYFDKVYIIKETCSKIYTLEDESVVFWRIMQEADNINKLTELCVEVMKGYDEESIVENLTELLNQLQKFEIVIVE